MLDASRFFIQWIASERAGRSIVPPVFWILSILGSTILLIYAIKIKDPVFIVGQLFGSFVYVRNLVLVHKKKYSGNDL